MSRCASANGMVWDFSLVQVPTIAVSRPSTSPRSLPSSQALSISRTCAMLYPRSSIEVISRSRVRCVSLNSAIRPTRNGGGSKPRSRYTRMLRVVVPASRARLWMADGGVEQLRHRVFDDLPRLPPDAFGHAPQVRQNAGDGAGFSAVRPLGCHLLGG